MASRVWRSVRLSRAAFSYSSAIFWALCRLVSLVEIRRWRPCWSRKHAVQYCDFGCRQMELIKVDSLEAVPPIVERRRSNVRSAFPLGALCFWVRLGFGGLGRLRFGQALAFQCLDSLVIEDRGREALINQCVSGLPWIIAASP